MITPSNADNAMELSKLFARAPAAGTGPVVLLGVAAPVVVVPAVAVELVLDVVELARDVVDVEEFLEVLVVVVLPPKPPPEQHMTLSGPLHKPFVNVPPPHAPSGTHWPLMFTVEFVTWQIGHVQHLTSLA